MASGPGIFLFLFLAACGRVGFDSTDATVGMDGSLSDADGGGDARSDSDSSTDDAAGDGGVGDGGRLPDFIYLEYDSVQSGATTPLRAADGDLVGDTWLSSAGSGVWDMSIRYAPLEGGVPIVEPAVIRGRLTEADDGRFILDALDGYPDAVFAFEQVADRWTFTLDRDDPRSAGALGTYVDISILHEEPAPSTDTRGVWLLEEFTIDGVSYPGRFCTMLEGTPIIVDAIYDVDPMAETRVILSNIEYLADGCATESMRDDVQLFGFVIERPGGRTVGYFEDTVSGSGVQVTYDVRFFGEDRLELTSRACVPAPCPLFDSVVLVRSPATM